MGKKKKKFVQELTQYSHFDPVQELAYYTKLNSRAEESVGGLSASDFYRIVSELACYLWPFLCRTRIISLDGLRVYVYTFPSE